MDSGLKHAGMTSEGFCKDVELRMDLGLIAAGTAYTGMTKKKGLIQSLNKVGYCKVRHAGDFSAGIQNSRNFYKLRLRLG